MLEEPAVLLVWRREIVDDHIGPMLPHKCVEIDFQIPEFACTKSTTKPACVSTTRSISTVSGDVLKTAATNGRVCSRVASLQGASRRAFVFRWTR